MAGRPSTLVYVLSPYAIFRSPDRYHPLRNTAKHSTEVGYGGTRDRAQRAYDGLLRAVSGTEIGGVFVPGGGGHRRTGHLTYLPTRMLCYVRY
eukprot:1620090-Rhodomonas_salina.2